MRHCFTRTCFLISIFCLCLAPIAAQVRADPPATRYSVTDLGPIGDIRLHGYTPDWSLNGKGDVAWRTDDDNQAYLWSGGRRVPLGDLTRVAVRNDGKVVGLHPADPADGGYHQTTYHTVLWDGGKSTDLGPTGILVGDALGINSQGAIVGSADSPAPLETHGSHALLSEGGRLTDLCTMGGGYGVATAVNGSGQVVGYSVPADVHDQRGFLWEKGHFTDLGTMPGFIDYAPNAINDKGQVVGWAFSFDDLKTHRSTGPDHAFLWEKGKMLDLGTLGGHDSHAYAINGLGQVVGTADTADGRQAAFLYRSGALADLNGLVPSLPGKSLASDVIHHLSAALAINDRGQIVALGGTLNNVAHAFLLTPTAPPSFADMFRNPPTVLHPRGTGVMTGRVVYEGGQPAASVVVVAAMQDQASLSLEMPYMIQHGGELRDEKGEVIGLSYMGPMPQDIEGVQSARAVTAADGTYRLAGLTTAPYNLWVVPKGTSPSAEIQRPWAWVAAAAEGVAAQEDKSVIVPDLTLTHGVFIQGRVLDQATGSPLKGIIVTCHGPQRPASSGQTLNTATDASGRFTLRVTPGQDELGIGGVMVNVRGMDEMHDWAAKFDNVLWSLDNHFEAVLDGGPPEQKSSPVDTVTVRAAAGQTPQVVFRLRRGMRQYQGHPPEHLMIKKK